MSRGESTAVAAIGGRRRAAARCGGGEGSGAERQAQQRTCTLRNGAQA